MPNHMSYVGLQVHLLNWPKQTITKCYGGAVTMVFLEALKRDISGRICSQVTLINREYRYFKRKSVKYSLYIIYSLYIAYIYIYVFKRNAGYMQEK